MKEINNGNSIKVLLIGKDRRTEELLSETLSAIGYRSYIVKTVSDATKTLSKSDLDLIIGDPQRFDGSWSDFLGEVKNKNPRIPVIFITDENDDRKDEYLKSGADGIITKPFRIGQIEELIATALLNCDKSSIVPRKKSKRILIVDDDEITLNLLHNALAILGYESVAADSSRKALECYKHEKFDLLITDYIMPEMSGKELISAVKAIDDHIPAVVITGYPLAYPATTARAEGIDGYLKKPFRVNHLREILNDLFKEN